MRVEFFFRCRRWNGEYGTFRWWAMTAYVTPLFRPPIYNVLLIAVSTFSGFLKSAKMSTASLVRYPRASVRCNHHLQLLLLPREPHPGDVIFRHVSYDSKFIRATLATTPANLISRCGFQYPPDSPTSNHQWQEGSAFVTFRPTKAHPHFSLPTGHQCGSSVWPPVVFVSFCNLRLVIFMISS